MQTCHKRRTLHRAEYRHSWGQSAVYWLRERISCPEHWVRMSHAPQTPSWWCDQPGTSSTNSRRGGRYYNGQYHVTETSARYPFEALLVAAPLLMGVPIFGLGVWGLFQRPGALRQGMLGAAVFLAVISTQGANVTNLYYAVSATTAEQVSNQSLVGLGEVVLYACLLVAATSAISMLAMRDQKPAAQPRSTE
jgi:hypothetical protein